MELVDCHSHTRYSDGVGTVRESIEAAAELGLTTLCFTDHLTLPHSMDPTCEVSVAESDLPLYREEVLEARAAAPELDVVFGFECDYYPGCEANIARWSQGATFLLGSVHMVDGRWIDDLSDLSYWEEHPVEDVWNRYFEVWAEACQSSCNFDSMAHPDLVSLLGRYPCASLLETLYSDAAEVASESMVRIEVNTAGLIKPVGRMYPAPELLAKFSRAGVRATVGSDAHAPRRVGERVADAYRLLYESGYRSIDVPTSEGGWRTVAL